MLPDQLQPVAPAQPRAIGTAVVEVAGDAQGHTRLQRLRQTGAMKVLFPQTFRRDMQGVVVNTAGGMTGGDRFDVQASVQAAGRLTMTTQAAERVYRALGHKPATVRNSLTGEEGARLNWLPQETMLFDASRLNRRLEIDLQSSAQVLMVETLVFGRAAMGEAVGQVDLKDRISIMRDGVPVFCDGVTMTGSAVEHLSRAAIAQGAGGVSTVVLVHPQAATFLKTLRDLLPPIGGASLLADDVLVARALAPDSFDLRCALIPMLEHLSDTPLPAAWRL